MKKPFSNGLEYSLWLDKCCGVCKKNVELVDGKHIAHCDIEEELAWASVTNGMIPDKVHERMGEPLEFACKEIEVIEEA